jgi:hypothetical protein
MKSYSSKSRIELAIGTATVVGFFSIILSYILTFYFEKNTGSALLYAPNDPGYVASPDLSSPIFGVHYFGDFLQILSYASIENPYSTDLSFPAPYLPLSILIFKPFVSLNPAILMLLIVSLSFFAIGYSILRVLRGFSLFYQITFLFICTLLTRPFMLSLDRGNIQAIVVGLSILFVIFWQEDKTKLAIGFLVIAISLKGYPIFLLIILLREKKFRMALFAILSSGIISIISLLILSPSKVLEFPLGLLKGVAVQSGYSTSGLSFASSLARFGEALGIFDPIAGYDRRFSIVGILIGITGILITIFYFQSRSRFPDHLRNIIVLAMPTFLVPVSWGYNAIWISFFVIYLCKNPITYTGVFAKFESKINYFFIASFSGLIVPMPFLWRGSTRVATGLMELFIPVLFVIFLSTLMRSNNNAVKAQN